MKAIDGKEIYFCYDFGEREKWVLSNIQLEMERGEFVAVLGRNGSGKSTLVRHFNGLVPLQAGSLMVEGIDVTEDEKRWELCKKCGMVFQNPDNQFVSSVVKEDVAFGLENYDTPLEEVEEKVKRALDLVGMDGFENRSPHSLSGGQKQRVALAGVLAMEPELIVFDEACSMLDPEGRTEILDQMRQFHQKGKTIVMITHYVEEALLASRIILMGDGKILADGEPKKILTNPELLDRAGLLPPVPVQLYLDLKKCGINLEHCPLTEEELVDEICILRKKKGKKYVNS